MNNFWSVISLPQKLSHCIFYHQMCVRAPAAGYLLPQNVWVNPQLSPYYVADLLFTSLLAMTYFISYHLLEKLVNVDSFPLNSRFISSLPIQYEVTTTYRPIA